MNISEPSLEQLVSLVATSEQLSYAAGIIDGEGWIGMVRIKHKEKANPTYGIRIKVNMTDSGPPRMLCSIFGGNLREVRHKNLLWKLQYQWDCAGRLEVMKCLIAIQDKLIVKRLQADLALQYLSAVGNNERNSPLREVFYYRMKELNK